MGGMGGMGRPGCGMGMGPMGSGMGGGGCQGSNASCQGSNANCQGSNANCQGSNGGGSQARMRPNYLPRPLACGTSRAVPRAGVTESPRE